MSVSQTAARLRFASKANLSPAQARRYLRRAQAGVRQSEVDSLTGGSLERWLDEQMGMPVFQGVYSMVRDRQFRRRNGSIIEAADAMTAAGNYQGLVGAQAHIHLKFRQIEHPDVFRHRVTMGLLDLLVCSSVGNSQIDSNSLLAYVERLERSCFSTYRNLLDEVTRSNHMAEYLTYLGNKKADPSTGAQPDENYAREIMQLFSIGLFELNLDGTRKKTGELDPSDPRYVAGGIDDVPTYGPSDIKNVARIFTGTQFQRTSGAYLSARLLDMTNYSGVGSTAQTNYPLLNLENIDFNPAENDSANAKVALPGTGGFLLNVAAGTGGETAYAALLDSLVSHPSCAPFVSKRLIQIFTCSNPRPEYVARVASVFRNNGAGQIGDMKAVLKAIFMDQDALAPSEKRLTIKPRDIDMVMRSMMRSLTPESTFADNLSTMVNYSTEYQNKLGALEHGSFSNEQRSALLRPPMRAQSVFGRWPTEHIVEGKNAPELHTWDAASVSMISSQETKIRLRALFVAAGGDVATAMSDANVGATFDQFSAIWSSIQVPAEARTQALNFIRTSTIANDRFSRMCEVFMLSSLGITQD